MTDLSNDTTWTNTAGRVTPLEDLTSTHRYHIRYWLERNATKLKSDLELKLLSFSSTISGEAASDDFDHLYDKLLNTPALTWLRETPLYKRLLRLEQVEAEQAATVMQTQAIASSDSTGEGNDADPDDLVVIVWERHSTSRSKIQWKVLGVYDGFTSAAMMNPQFLDRLASDELRARVHRIQRFHFGEVNP